MGDQWQVDRLDLDAYLARLGIGADAILAEVLSPDRRARFAEQRDLGFVYEVPGVGRFRGNAFLQHRGAGVVFRVITEKIPTVE